MKHIISSASGNYYLPCQKCGCAQSKGKSAALEINMFWAVFHNESYWYDVCFEQFFVTLSQVGVFVIIQAELVWTHTLTYKTVHVCIRGFCMFVFLGLGIHPNSLGSHKDFNFKKHWRHCGSMLNSITPSDNDFTFYSAVDYTSEIKYILIFHYNVLYFYYSTRISFVVLK